jgi:tetratricopeptide (TPR) repeat protein
MGADDQIMKQAMALVTGDEKMMLTHEEERLLSLTPGAVNFKSSLRPTPEELTNATNRLQQFNQDLTGVAHRSFAKGDFQATRGILEIIIDEDPGAWEAMVNLGIVHMKLDDHFDAAKHFRQSILVAGDRKVPFAHFMLGDVLYRSEILDESVIELQKSLALEPDNAKAHVILGNISGTKNQMEDAEFHFKEAILQDPNLFEPYVNLAIIYLQQGKIEEAKTNYTESLRKGGPTRPALAERLGI